MTDQTFTIDGQIELPCPHCHNRSLHPNLRCADVRHGMVTYYIVTTPPHNRLGPDGRFDWYPPAEFTALAEPCPSCDGIPDLIPLCPFHCYEGEPTVNLERVCVTRDLDDDGNWIGVGWMEPIGRATLARLLPVKDRPSGPERGDGPMVYLFGSCWWLWFDEGNYHAIKLPANVDPGWWVALMEVCDD